MAIARSWDGWRTRGGGCGSAHRFWANVVITALRGPAGVLQGYGKVTRDLSERRRDLRTAEERFRRAFADAPIGMAIVAATLDAPGRFADVNTAMCELTGYDRAGLLLMTLGSLAVPSAVDSDAETIGRILSGQVDRSLLQTKYITAAGDVIDVTVGLSLVRDPTTAVRCTSLRLSATAALGDGMRASCAIWPTTTP